MGNYPSVLIFEFSQSKVPARYSQTQEVLGVRGVADGHAPPVLEPAATA